jgi:hypothetical protein
MGAVFGEDGLVGRGTPKFARLIARKGAHHILWKIEGPILIGRGRFSGQHVIGDGGSGCGDDRAFEDDSEAGIGFELLNRTKRKAARRIITGV